MQCVFKVLSISTHFLLQKFSLFSKLLCFSLSVLSQSSCAHCIFNVFSLEGVKLHITSLIICSSHLLSPHHHSAVEFIFIAFFNSVHMSTIVFMQSSLGSIRHSCMYKTILGPLFHPSMHVNFWVSSLCLELCENQKQSGFEQAYVTSWGSC